MRKDYSHAVPQYPYRRTSVWDNHLHEEMRVMVAKLLPTLQFRHHGAGAAQAYIREGVEPEVRVHIWHPDLVLPGIETSGQIHDHRFDLQSTVLHGSIHHDEYHLTPDLVGDWQQFTVVHARAGVADPPKLVNRMRYLAKIVPGVIKEGEAYSFGRRLFHRGWPEGLAVTLVSKHTHEDASARLLAPACSSPVHAFKDNWSPERLAPYVAMAQEALNTPPAPPPRCYKCRNPAEINDGPDHMGPEVCCDCYCTGSLSPTPE